MTNQKEPINYLIEHISPPKKTEDIYQFEKSTKTEFGEVMGPQTHSYRRKLILEAHPQIAQLLVGGKPYTIILTAILVPLAMYVTYLVKDSSWPVFLLVNYFFGGTICHTLHVLIHDYTHWSGHSNITINKILAIICNIPMGVPSAIPFGKYHADHHNFLSEENLDPDLPVAFEAKLSQYKLYKFFYFYMSTVYYALRPLAAHPQPLNRFEMFNWVTIIITDIMIYHFWGGSAFLYVILSAFYSIGPHPAAMHVIAEHYEFVKGMQTYDYFGVWNILNLDLGLHTEHHDFPTCPWYNLRKVRALAPQFYEYLPHHTSYLQVAKKLLFDDNFNLYFRTHRINKSKSA